MAALLALVSSLLWGSADYQAGKMSKGHPPLAVLATSQAFGLLTGIVLAIASGQWRASAFGEVGYAIPGALAGLTGYIGLVALYRGLSTGRMGVVSPLSSLGAIVPLSYALVQGERLSSLGVCGVVLALTGAFLASGPELKGGVSIAPVVLGLTASLGFGVALTFMAIGSESSALMTMTMMRATTFIVGIIIYAKVRHVGGLNRTHLPILMMIGSADFAANLLLGVATTKGLVSLAMVLGSLYPIVTALLAFKFLHERLHRIQYLGVALAVGGVAVISAL